jgi:protein-arginine kinase activator protein McsA
MRKWTTKETEMCIALLQDYKSFEEIGAKVGRSAKAVKVHLNKLGLRKRDYSFEIITCPQCNETFSGHRNHNRKFCSHSCAAVFNNNRLGTAKPPTLCASCEEPVPTRNRKYCSTECVPRTRTSATAIRKHVLRTRNHACELCKRKTWNKQPIPLEVDHIDGNHTNNKETNLRLLCPNCHALTPTYKNRNNGNGRHKRLQRYHEGKSY